MALAEFCRSCGLHACAASKSMVRPIAFAASMRGGARRCSQRQGFRAVRATAGSPVAPVRRETGLRALRRAACSGGARATDLLRDLMSAEPRGNWAPHSITRLNLSAARDAAAQSGAANAGDCPGSETLDARSLPRRGPPVQPGAPLQRAETAGPFDRPRRNGPIIAFSLKSAVCRRSAARRGTAGSRPSRSLQAASSSLECRRSLKCGGSRSDACCGGLPPSGVPSE